jgi:orotidine-5'-phosphate decarboxylase
MTRSQLHRLILQRRSFLCVGLDTDPDRLPDHLRQEADPVFSFNQAIIDATRDLCVAYKPNLAFYEAQGSAGWMALEKTIRYIGPDHFVIADAKRGDIGNTSRQYARAFFEQLRADALTVAPYMGADSVKPFLGFDQKWVILLALTSNPGSDDFQKTLQEEGRPLYEKVMRKAMSWAGPDELMFVVGATHPERFADIRRIAPKHFLLVPGVGAQGGSLEAICRHGFNDQVGLLVNSSRGILYAGSGPDFAAAARRAALALQQQMEALLNRAPSASEGNASSDVFPDSAG